MYLAPKVVLSSSSEMHNEHHVGCAIAVRLIYGPPWWQWGWGKWWPPPRNSKWIQILESLSCSILLDLLWRKCLGGRHGSSRRINQLLRAQYLCCYWTVVVPGEAAAPGMSLLIQLSERGRTGWLGNCLHLLYFCQPKVQEKNSCLFRSWHRVSPLWPWTQEYRINVEKPILKLCVL